MPTYEFRCPTGHDFEKFFRKISDSVAELPCPDCGAVAVRRVSAGGGLVFKGSGFYITDYAKPRPKEAGEGASAPDSKTQATEEGTGAYKPAKESKPAAEAKTSDSLTASTKDAKQDPNRK